MKLWHIATTEPNAEKKAKKFLELRGLRARWLRYKGSRLNHGRKVPALLSLLPGYLFVELEVGVDELGEEHMPGCTGLMMRGSRPATLSPKEANKLFRKCDADDVVLLDNVSTTWTSNVTQLRLVEGPFKDISAVFDETDARNRVWIFLNCLGVVQRVRVPENWVEATAT